jgi:hypothetical protein
MSEKPRTREMRIRRMAERQRLALRSSRRRDPYASDFGKFMLLNEHETPVFGHQPFEYSASLDEIEAFLKRGKTGTRASEGQS